MSQKSVFCIANTHEQADRIVRQLKDVGFTHDDISVLFPDKETTHAFAHEKNTKAPEGAVTGASTGGVVGGVLGWIVGIGALAIPGVGPFIAAGPLMAALSGAAIGAAAGGLTGGLIGLGIPELDPNAMKAGCKPATSSFPSTQRTPQRSNQPRRSMSRRAQKTSAPPGSPTIQKLLGQMSATMNPH